MTPRQAASTELATLADYQRQGSFNVLAPAVDITGPARSEVLIESISVVQINAGKDSAEIYHDFRYANEREGKAALSSLGLAKIAAAAGIKWIPELCRLDERERRPDGHVYVRYTAGAGLRQPNGEWHIETASKAIDTADVAEQMADADRRSFERMRGKSNAPAWMKGLGKDAENDGTLERAIEGRVKQQLLQLREHIESHAETKAKSRVIRRILSLKQTYSREELARPFAVPRLLYRPDLADPLAIEQVQMEGRQAAEALYGAPSTTRHDIASGRPSAALPPSAPSSPDPEGSSTPEVSQSGRQTEATAGADGASSAASGAAETPAPDSGSGDEPSEDGATTAGGGAPSSDHVTEVSWRHLVELCDGDRAKARRQITKANKRQQAVNARNENTVTEAELATAIQSLEGAA